MQSTGSAVDEDREQTKKHLWFTRFTHTPGAKTGGIFLLLFHEGNEDRFLFIQCQSLPLTNLQNGSSIFVFSGFIRKEGRRGISVKTFLRPAFT